MRSSPKDWILSFLCCTLLLAGSLFAFAQNSPANDELLQLLQQSMKSNFDSLQHTNYPVYFMAYRLNEKTEHQTSANFGYIYDNLSSKSVFLTIEIRVGSPETDNYHFLSSRNNCNVTQIALPLDYDSNLIKKILTKETNQAYSKAIIQFVENQTFSAILQQDDKEPYAFLISDFDKYYEPPLLDSHWDEDNIAQSLRHCTKETIPSPELTELSANLVFQTNRKYLVTSENRSVVENHCSTTLTLKTEGLSSNNNLEHIEHQYFTKFPDQLPDADVLQKEMRNMVVQLSNVLHISNYSSNGTIEYEDMNIPVLLSGKTASILAHHLFGHEMENNRHNLVKGTIIPEEFSVICDPTITKYNGNILSGSYQFDDEGIVSQAISLIDKGVPDQIPATRTQKPGSSYSNGHARGNRQMPAPRQSNLIVTTSKPKNYDQLKTQLLAEARQQNKEFGLYVEDAEIRCDTTRGILTIYPTVCYKVFTHNLPDEEVRDIIVCGSTQQWFNNLISGGDASGSVSIVCHNMNDEIITHSCSPALLFRQAEIHPVVKRHEKRIVNQIVAPTSDTKENLSELFLQTAQEEWTTDVKEMTVGDINAPYYQEYLMTDARLFTVEASEGSLFYSNEKQVRNLTPKVLLGSDLSNNNNLYEVSDAIPTSYKLPIDNRNGVFVRDFRKATEAEYLKAVTQWEIKKTTTPQTDKNHPSERSYTNSIQSFDEHSFNLPTLDNLELLARETSASLDKYGLFSHSGVNIYVMMGNVYYWNSERIVYIRPVYVIGMQLYGTMQLTDGEDYSDGRTIFFPNTDSLFSTQYVQNEMDLLIRHFKNVKKTNTSFNGNYFGPILVENEAVGQLLVTTLLEHTPNLLAYRESHLTPSHQTNKKSFEDKLDKKIVSTKISVTANKFGDAFDQATFCRHDKTDADGVEITETEIIRNGELITLLGNRNITKSTPYSNGFQQLAINKEGCFATQGGNRIDFEHKSTVPHSKLKQMLIKEAKKQGCQYAYILRQMYDQSLQNITADQPLNTKLLQLYRVDVHTGKEIPVTGASINGFNFYMLDNIVAVSNQNTAFPVMMKVNGTSGTRDFPFAGVPTCIVAPDGLLLKSAFLHP